MDNNITAFKILKHLPNVLHERTRSACDEDVYEFIENTYFNLIKLCIKYNYKIGDLVYNYNIKDAIKIEDLDLNIEYKDSGDCGTSGYSYWVYNKQGLQLWWGNLNSSSNYMKKCTIKEYQKVTNPLALLLNEYNDKEKKRVNKIEEITKLEKEIKKLRIDTININNTIRELNDSNRKTGNKK